MNNAGLLTAAARLLVEIAGPAPQHIEMSRRGPKKYYTVARALTLNDARQHLRGIKTLPRSLPALRSIGPARQASPAGIESAYRAGAILRQG